MSSFSNKCHVIKVDSVTSIYFIFECFVFCFYFLECFVFLSFF